MNKNVLIICWEFPPVKDIGGRRWAKTAKSLDKFGYSVSVIASKPPDDEKMIWLTKQELAKMKVYTYSNFFLVNWLNDYQSPLSFLKIRTARFLLATFFKGTIFDKTVGLKSKLTSEIRRIIKADAVEIIFVTGAPFNLLYYTSTLKNEFPGVKILADYRDPWLTAHNYGMANLSPERKKHELYKQNFVFENVDFVTAPNATMLREIKEKYTGKVPPRAKFKVLPHAFDPDDIRSGKIDTLKDDRVRIVYGGAMYAGTAPSLKLLNESVLYIKSRIGSSPTDISFYTDQKQIPAELKGQENFIEFSETIGDKIFDEIRTADFVIILLAEHNKNYLTSKFFEFLPYRKPYLCLGPEGEASKTIVAEGLGYHLQKIEDLYNIIANAQQLKDTYPPIDNYTFDAVTRGLLDIVNE